MTLVFFFVVVTVVEFSGDIQVERGPSPEATVPLIAAVLEEKERAYMP